LDSKNINCSELNSLNKTEAKKLFTRSWGADYVVSKGVIHRFDDLEGIAAVKDIQIKGMLTYNIVENEMEIVSVNSYLENTGIGSELLARAVQKAKDNKCNRVWLITTNDSTPALRFYQKKGFRICNIYIGSIKESRKLKPEIPLTGFDGIPIEHEIELELLL
jgi:RimJ/RimL family protein N-acetyltransferase